MESETIEVSDERELNSNDKTIVIPSKIGQGADTVR